MINKSNYYEKIKGIDFSKLDESLLEGREFIDDLTQKGSDWSIYDSDSEIREVADLYFEELSKAIRQKPVQRKSTPRRRKTAEIKFKEDQYYVNLFHEGMASLDYKTSLKAKEEFEGFSAKEKSHFYSVLLENESSDMAAEKVTIASLKKEVKYLTSSTYLNDLKKPKRTVSKKAASKKQRKKPEGKAVESFSLEFKFIKRFLNLHGKKRVRNHFRLFINALQRAIRERAIRKTSPYAKEIMAIQNALIEQYDGFKSDSEAIEVDIPESTRNKFIKIIGKEYEMPSIKLIKSYIGIQGKTIENVKASRLLKRIERALDNGLITKRDKYYDKINQIRLSLDAFVKKNKKEGLLKIEKQALNGLRLIFDDSSTKRKQHPGSEPAPLDVEKLTEDYYSSGARKNRRFYMRSTDLERETFNHIGLTGKWYDFIGDPEVGFRAMVSGQPKMGKSFLMIEFAGELADKHGPVLYVAKEEGKSATLKEKLMKTHAAHPNMIVSDYIPENIDEFQFVFFDSVTKLGLSPENLIAINGSFLKTSFIEIHQVTKQGSARGKNDFAHDPDVLIHIPEKGLAIQNGRYNQGGSLKFFNNKVA